MVALEKPANVSDTSDDTNTGAPNDPTVVNVTPIPGIEVTKTVTVQEMVMGL